MKFTMPILALIVAILLVASQSIYTVDQTKYAIKFQLGEIVETKTQPGLYFKIPLIQNVRFFDNRNLTLENSEPDRVTTLEKMPLLADFIVLWRINDVKQYYVSVQGDEEAARRRLSQTVRSNLAEEFNKHTMHDAISSERDRITTVTRQKADADAKTIGVEVVDVRLRRIELPPDVTGPVYQRMESERRRVANELRSTGAAESEKIRADADRQRQVILADAYRAAQKVKGEGDAEASRHLCAGLWSESGVLRFLPESRRLQVDIQEQERPRGPRPECRVLPVFQAVGFRSCAARDRQVVPTEPNPSGRLVVDSLWPAFALLLIVEGILPFAAPRIWRETFRKLIDMSDSRIAVHRVDLDGARCCFAGRTSLCVNGCSRKRSRTFYPRKPRVSRRCAVRYLAIFGRAAIASCRRRSSNTSIRC